jgi:hypothetical protein
LHPTNAITLNRKDLNMLYKTIVLELIQSQPELAESLRRSRTMLMALERHAQELAESHTLWTRRLSEAAQEGNPGQIASAALEIAVKELEHRLSSGWATRADAESPFSLEAVMAYLHAHTPPA